MNSALESPSAVAPNHRTDGATPAAATKPAARGGKVKKTCFVGFILIVGGVGALVAALSHRPAFYVERVEKTDSAVERVLSSQCVSKAVALVGEIDQQSKWSASFGEGHLNAWLAVDMVDNHADTTLPPGVDHPRLALQDGSILLAFRYGSGGLAVVVTTKVKAWIPKQNLLAMELEGTWLGAVPIPGSYLRRMIENFARANNLTVRWHRHGSNLIALFDFTNERGRVAVLKFEVADKELRLQGTSGRAVKPAGDYAPGA
ncbi:MAG: hypothetical protein ACRC1K_02765 [Planctomycetia bacterium]